MGADVVIVDEAHFIPEESIENGLNAMILQGACAVLASTPPKGKSGIQSLLENKRDDTGEYVCTQVDFDFTCPTCKEVQVKNKTYMCPHRWHWRPPVQSDDSVMISRALFGGNQEAFNREIMGTSVISSNLFIEPEHVMRLRNKSLVTRDTPPHFVYVSMDPSGATKKYIDGHTSDYAITTAYFKEGQVTVTKKKTYIIIILLYINICLLQK
jgi:hypothetical protein